MDTAKKTGKLTGSDAEAPAGQTGHDGAEHTAGKTSRRRKWVFRIMAVTVMPAAFLLLLEGVLRVAGFGYPTDFLVKVDGQDAYTGNPKFGWRFFPRPLARTPALIHLPADKPKGSYRIFVLGGSAAMGTPGPAYGFARILAVMLERSYPATRFEVVNAAMTAVNSHVVLPIAEDCAEHDGDLFIVYMGNNEVVGPFGPGTVFQTHAPSRGMIRAGLWLTSTRIGQLFQSLARAVRGGDRVRGEWRGMEMFLQRRVADDDPRLQTVAEHFRANLTDVCRVAADSGAKVIVCTVATNLRDNAPLASMHRPGLSATQKHDWEQTYQAGVALEKAGELDASVQQYLAAATIDDRFADLQFRLARCYLALGRLEQAHQHYVQARDLDALRFRADSRIDAIIRQVASGRSGRGVHLIDAQQVLARSRPSDRRPLGKELFHDHVHLNFDGNYALARALLDKVAELLPASVRGTGAPPTPPAKDRCAELLALSDLDRYLMALQIWRTTGRAPFTNRLDHAERRERAFARLRLLRGAGTSPAGLEQALRTHRAAIEARQDDLPVRRGLAQLLMQRGDVAEAADRWRELLRRLPHNADMHLGLGAALLAQGDSPLAESHFDKALAAGVHRVEYCNRIGETLAGLGKLDEAIGYYRRGLKIEPAHAKTLNDLGAVFFRKRQYDRAVAEFSKAVDLSPNEPDFQRNLGVALAFRQQLDQAATHLGQAVRIDPLSAAAHDALATVLARQGKVAQVVEHLGTAARLEPDDPNIQRRYAEAVQRLGGEGQGDRP